MHAAAGPPTKANEQSISLISFQLSIDNYLSHGVPLVEGDEQPDRPNSQSSIF